MRQEASLASGKLIRQDCGTLAVVTLSRSSPGSDAPCCRFDLKKVYRFLASLCLFLLVLVRISVWYMEGKHRERHLKAPSLPVCNASEVQFIFHRVPQNKLQNLGS